MEIWKTIPFASDYEASTHGRIKAKCRIITTVDGDKRVVKEKVLKCGYARKGYKRVVLSVGDKSMYKFVHRVIGETFLETSGERNQINHINGIKDDNRLINLEWVTNQENRDHAVRKNLVARGYMLPQTRHDESIIKDVLDMYSRGIKQKDIALKYGVCQQSVSKWVTRGNHLSIKIIRP